MSECISPKRIRALKIEDFSMADRRLLRAAFHAYVPMVLIGGIENENPHVIAVGHPDGLAAPGTTPADSRYYSTIRIRGVGAPEEAPLYSAVAGAARSG